MQPPAPFHIGITTEQGDDCFNDCDAEKKQNTTALRGEH